MESTLDECLVALADEHRRRLLAVLRARDRSDGMALSTILTQQPGDPEKLWLTYQHVHCPKLDECGLIDWNREKNVVSLGPRFEDFEPVIAACQSVELEPNEDAGS